MGTSWASHSSLTVGKAQEDERLSLVLPQPCILDALLNLGEAVKVLGITMVTGAHKALSSCMISYHLRVYHQRPVDEVSNDLLYREAIKASTNQQPRGGYSHLRSPEITRRSRVREPGRTCLTHAAVGY